MPREISERNTEGIAEIISEAIRGWFLERNLVKIPEKIYGEIMKTHMETFLENYLEMFRKFRRKLRGKCRSDPWKTFFKLIEIRGRLLRRDVRRIF